MSSKLLQTGAWLLALALAALFLKPLTRTFPPDFMQFYYAGRMVADGHVSQLYNRRAYEPLDTAMRAQSPLVLPAHYFNRPAFAALPWVALAPFSYGTAARIAVLLNVGLLGLLIWKLPLWFNAPSDVRAGLAAFMPFLWSIGIGQDTLLLTLLLAWSLHLSDGGRPTEAGLVLALCSFKPHLVWALPLALIAAGRRRMMYSFLAGASVLGVLSIALVGTEGLRQWFDVLRAPTTDYAPQNMANLRALFLRWGPAAGALAATLTVACFALALRRGTIQEKISAALIAGLLLSPHTYPQDYSLMAVVALASTERLWRYAFLLPWPFFYPREDALPLIGLSITCLAAMAFKAERRHLSSGIEGPCQFQQTDAANCSLGEAT